MGYPWKNYIYVAYMIRLSERFIHIFTEGKQA